MAWLKLTVRKQTLVFKCVQYKSFENTVEEGEIAHNDWTALFDDVIYYLQD